jgi:hypothetical protein
MTIRVRKIEPVKDHSARIGVKRMLTEGERCPAQLVRHISC